MSSEFMRRPSTSNMQARIGGKMVVILELVLFCGGGFCVENLVLNLLWDDTPIDHILVAEDSTHHA